MSEEIKEMNQAEALFSFMAWLTSRKEVSGPFSEMHEAGQAAELVGQYCKAQGWEVTNWYFAKLIKPVKE